MSKCIKIPCPDRKTAENVINFDLKRKQLHSRKPNKRAKPYLCEYCGQWHLTTMTKKEYKRIKKRARYN